MRMLRELMFMSGLVIATAVFPAMAEEDQQPAPSEDHGAHHGGMDQQPSQQPPGGGMMGGAQGGGMMGGDQGGMSSMMGGGEGGKGGMMGGCPMMGDSMGGMMGHGMGAMMMGSMPMMEGRLAYIKADLGITADQEQAWNAYADAVRARHKAMEGMHTDMMKTMQGGSAVERLDARIKAMEAMVDSLKALKPATEALYAVLSDEQKKKADKLLGGGYGMM